MAFSLALMIRIEKTLSAVSLIGALAVVTLFLLAAFSKASAMTIVPFAIARLVHIHFYSDSGKKGRPKRYMVGLLIGLLVLADFGVVYSVHLSNRDSEARISGSNDYQFGYRRGDAFGNDCYCSSKSTASYPRSRQRWLETPRLLKERQKWRWREGK